MPANSAMRAIAGKYPRTYAAARRMVKLIWWTLTFQLLAQYRRRKSQMTAPAVIPGNAGERNVGNPDLPEKSAARRHFVADYERVVAELLQNYPLDEAMSMAVGGATLTDYERTGRIEAQLLYRIGLENGMRLVDLGCGSGRLATALHDTAAIAYVGIDIVQSLLDYAKTRAPTYEFVLHRDLSIPQRSNSADMISAFSLFTHLLHAETFIYLEEAVRVLKARGRIVFSFLEYSEPAHWTVFVHTKNAQKLQPSPLNMFIERNTIKIWAGHLNLSVERFIEAGEVIGKYGALGQTVVVLRKNLAC